MSLSPALILAMAAVASYVVLSAVASSIIAGLWKAGLLSWSGAQARVRADRLAMTRLLPSFVLAAVTVFFVLPLFLAAEPPRDFERVGPAALALSIIGVGLVIRAAFSATRAVLTTSRIKRLWLRDAAPLTITGMPVRAYQIESAHPLVALVGIRRPVLVAARIVVDRCSESELATITRHERSHVFSRDNLKRLLIACVPDVLSLTPYHGAIASAWHHASEEAADDAATLGEPRARLELAELLLKVAHLAPHAQYTDAIVTPFIDACGLDRRVRHLVIDPSPRPAKSSRHLVSTALAAAVLILCALFFSNATGRIVHAAVESVLATGASGL